MLACCISGGKQQGSLFVNDQPVHPKLFRQQLAVVWQRDILLPTATVRTISNNTALPLSCTVHFDLVMALTHYISEQPLPGAHATSTIKMHGVAGAGSYNDQCSAAASSYDATRPQSAAR